MGLYASFPLLLCAMLAATCAGEAESLPPDDDEGLLRDVTRETGLRFSHFNGMTGAWYLVENMGAGGGLFDYDNDGDLDLYAVQGARLGTNDYRAALLEPPAERPPVDRLFRNELAETGRLTFTDVTEEAGLRADGYGMGVATGDFDNDGWTDLYVTNFGANQLWRNRGDGTFEDVTEHAGVDEARWSSAATWFDWNRDGWLDLFVVNYVRYSIETDIACYSDASLRDYCWPKAYAPEPDRFFVNRGDGTFEEATLAAGLAGAAGSGLGVVAADFDRDGWLDLYVANDGGDNHLWMNVEGRRFENRAVLSGIAVNGLGLPEASMGVAATDVDGDGDEDLFLTHFDGETNTLYRNDGTAFFLDETRRTGLALPSVKQTSFGVADFDLDNDGLLDFFVANGAVRSLREQRERGDVLPLKQRDQLFRNAGDGTFREAEAVGAALTRAEVGRGVATGDLDNDGDHDLVLFNNGGPARVYLNTVGQHRNWIGFRIREHGREALGAYVELDLASGKTLRRRVHTDGSFCSASDPRVLFGLGEESRVAHVRVTWSDGSETSLHAPAICRYHVIERASYD